MVYSIQPGRSGPDGAFLQTLFEELNNVVLEELHAIVFIIRFLSWNAGERLACSPAAHHMGNGSGGLIDTDLERGKSHVQREAHPSGYLLQCPRPEPPARPTQAGRAGWGGPGRGLTASQVKAFTMQACCC